MPTNEPLMVITADERLRGLLACGHWSYAYHQASSQWEFPDEAQTCDECDGAERQFDLRLQVILVNEDVIPYALEEDLA